MDAILLPYMGTGEALDATYLLCVVQATNWLHSDNLGGLCIMEEEYGRQQ